MHNFLMPLFARAPAACCHPRTWHAPAWRTARRRGRAAIVAAASSSGPSGSDAGYVAGIDLGTTNSAIAVVEGGEPVAIPNQEGRLTTPSVVGFLGDGAVLVGDAAKRQAAVNPANTFYSVKRLIGQDYEGVENEAQRLAFTVTADEDGFAVVDCPNAEAGRLYPEEVSAYVLAKLLAAAEEFGGGRPVTKAVISVPAYFNDAQREATITAGKLAGLETIRIIREPVAAALAYGLDAQEDQTVLVLDLGGGTYDVSLLEVGGGVIEVLSTGGDPHLGGDDWDAAITRWLIEKHLAPKGVDCRDPRILANLKAVSEAAKVGLSTKEKVVIRMPVGGGVEAELTRQTFEGLTADLFRRARLPLDQACWQAGVDLGTVLAEHDEQRRRAGGKPRKAAAKGKGSGGGAAVVAAEAGVQIRPKRRQPVSRVLLVGGATRMPAVRRFVRHMTGLEADEEVVDPDLAVALGAAVQAGIYQGQVGDLMVMDVWQASLMRAFAGQLERQRQQQEGEDLMEDAGEGGSDGEEEWGPEGELVQ